MEFKGLYLDDIAVLLAFFLIAALSFPAAAWIAEGFARVAPLALVTLPVALAAVVALYLSSPRMVRQH